MDIAGQVQNVCQHITACVQAGSKSVVCTCITQSGMLVALDAQFNDKQQSLSQ